MADDTQLPQQPTQEFTQAQPMEQPPSLTPVINPEGKVVNISQGDLQQALNQGYMQASPDDVSRHLMEQKYGSPGQQAIAGLEGAAEGLTFGLSTGAERAAGVNPEDIRGRKAVNPGTHTAGELGGLAVGSIYGTGEAKALEVGGEMAAKAAGLGSKATLLDQVGAHTVKAAFQSGLVQGGEEISNAFAQDPNQTAESAIADMGLATAMGGVFGGALGAAGQGLKRITPTFISELDRPAMEAGDFRSSIQNSNIIKDSEKPGILDGLTKQKKEAPEIKAAAERLGAPVMEGMTSDSPLVQKAEDSLINGAPTYSGIRRKALYEEGHQKAVAALDEVLGPEGTTTKAELGNSLKDSIVAQLEEQNAPIKAMYDKLKESHEVIPLENGISDSIANQISKIKELSLSPSSPEGQLAKRVLGEVGNLKTVDDVKAYKSILNRSISPTASSGEKRMAGMIGDMLTGVEESSVEKFASDMAKTPGEQRELLALIDQRKAANFAYKELISKVKTLSEQLGKGRVYGLQDAVHFMRDKLTPEEVVQKLFSKKDSEFLKFFSKEFPNEMELMRMYQKQALREVASKAGTFSPKVLFNNINKLEPEIQRSLFAPPELQKLQDAETYIRAFPKNFNPSGTSGMTAFRQFFEHPMGAAIANARDLGIEQFLKLVSKAPEVNNATELAKATVRGWNKASKGIKSILDPVRAELPSNVIDLTSRREKLDKLVQDYRKNPEKIVSMGDNNPVPEYATAFSAVSSRAINYLSMLKPDESPKNIFDSKMPASPDKLAAYNRALDIAQNPLTVLKNIKDGSFTPNDLVTLKVIYPSLYNSLSQKMQMEMINAVHDEKVIPYRTRMGISMFLAQPVDSTMTQSAIAAAQMSQSTQGGQQPQQSPAPPKKSNAALNKLSQGYQTPGQSRDVRNQRQK